MNRKHIRRLEERFFIWLMRLSALSAVAVLGLILAVIFWRGMGALSWEMVSQIAAGRLLFGQGRRHPQRDHRIALSGGRGHAAGLLSGRAGGLLPAHLRRRPAAAQRRAAGAGHHVGHPQHRLWCVWLRAHDLAGAARVATSGYHHSGPGRPADPGTHAGRDRGDDAAPTAGGDTGPGHDPLRVDGGAVAPDRCRVWSPRSCWPLVAASAMPHRYSSPRVTPTTCRTRCCARWRRCR